MKRIAKTYKFTPETVKLIERRAAEEGRSMTNYLEWLVLFDATLHEIITRLDRQARGENKGENEDEH